MPEKSPYAPRRASAVVRVGGVPVGGGHPIVVQSMTNTDTADAEATARQAIALATAGSEIVRITVDTRAAAEKVAEIRKRLDDAGCAAPLVGDFHFNGHVLLREVPGCARALAKYRINPGNVGRGSRHDENFATMVRIAADLGRSIRIGVNWGSLDGELLARLMDENTRRKEPLDADGVVREAMAESALRSADAAESLGLGHDRIVLSCKVSSVPSLVAVYRDVGRRTDLPLHLGLTEAGMGSKGIVASAAALAILLAEGIGDTIRVSLTPEPGGDRTLEVKVAQQLLQTIGIRSFSPLVTACPGCGRTTSTFFQELAGEVEAMIARRLAEWKANHPGVSDMTVAVMGCVVNGPGESRHADVGISLPGTGEEPKAPVYVDGRHVRTLSGPTLVRDFEALLEEYVRTHYPAG